MRKALKKNGTDSRRRYRATVGRFGEKSNNFGYYQTLEETIMFKNIIDVEKGRIITDHLWFKVGKQIDQLKLNKGDGISFDARVGQYTKGYYPNIKVDYKLKNMSKIVVEKRTGGKTNELD